MTTRTIEALCKRSRDISLEKGWLNPDGTDPRPFYTVTGLFHTELSEAFEEARNNKDPREVYYEVKFLEGDGRKTTEIVSRENIAEARKVEGKYGRGRDFLDAKPCGIPIEFADFVIRVCQYAGSTGNASKLHDLFEQVGEQTKDDFIVAENIEACITQLHADVSKAWVVHVDKGDDPIVYLASALLTLSNFCRRHGIDLWGAIDEKEAYNRTRPTRHGGKKH